MLRWLLAPFIVLVTLVLGPPEHRARVRTIDQVSDSIVRLSMRFDEYADGYVCTGEVVFHHLVLTAAHCLAPDMMVDDGPIRGILRLDSYADLALLDVKTEKPGIMMRNAGPERFEPLTALGYAHGWRRLTVLHVVPYLLGFTPGPDYAPGVWVQGAYISSMSGGPVVDNQGQMVSIVQRYVESENIGYGVDIQTIRDFLGEVLK